jgi:Na+/proline symporter
MGVGFQIDPGMKCPYSTWSLISVGKYFLLLIGYIKSPHSYRFIMSRQTDLRLRSLATIRSLLQTMITLASASLGFVAALAWNDAIKATFKKVLGEEDSLSALYTYAVVATLMAISVVALLGWFAAKVGGDAMIKREVDG